LCRKSTFSGSNDSHPGEGSFDVKEESLSLSRRSESNGGGATQIRTARFLARFAAVLVAAAPTLAQPTQPSPAAPIEPIAAILDAFKTHRVVALGEDHGNEQQHAFIRALIKDPRFAATVDDIVVEFGNARYQDLIDRFVRGEAVLDNTLRQVWQDTTQPHEVWDTPIYEAIYRDVRTINASLPRAQHLRVLLGDPPIDWDRLRTRDDLQRWSVDASMERSRYPANVIRREVLAKQRRALVIYGGLHLQRRHLASNFEVSDRKPTIVSLVEMLPDTKAFTIWPTTTLPDRQVDGRSWKAPSLALLRGTILGAEDFTFYYPFEMPRSAPNGRRIAREQWRTLRMEDQFDAVLYLGPPSDTTVARLPPSLCLDAAYMKMRQRRMALMPEPPPGFPDPFESLQRYCATVATR